MLTMKGRTDNMEYFIIIVILAIVVIVVLKHTKKEEEPTAKISATNIFNRLSNDRDKMKKVYSISRNQSVLVFEHNELILRLDDIDEFSIDCYFNDHPHDSTEDIETYQFFVLNQPALRRIPIIYKKPVKTKDARYDTLLQFKVDGSLSYEITDPEAFMNEVGLFKKSFSTLNLEAALRKYVHPLINSHVMALLKRKNISFIKINYYLKDLEEEILKSGSDTFKALGCNLKDIKLSEVIIGDTKELKKLNTLLLDNNKFKLQNYSYIDEKKKEFLERNHLKAHVVQSSEVKRFASVNSHEDGENIQGTNSPD